jgi:L-malate glycosyltransferase
MIAYKDVDVLVVANRYPGVNSYGGEFIHARSKFYYKKIDFLAIDLRPDSGPPRITSHEDICVLRADFRYFTSVLQRINAKCVVLHSPSRLVYESLLNFFQKEQIITIHHGAESVNLIDRYDFLQREHSQSSWKYLCKSQRRKMKFIGELIADKDVKTVFVSNYLKEVCEQDSGLNAANYEIIHNSVEKNFFSTEEHIKENIHRTNILLVREFTLKFAADIGIRIINSLSKYKLFSSLNVNIYGFGDNWLTWTKPISYYNNVSFYNHYTPHSKMPSLMRDNDILLAPTRHDTQGLLMCEGMASGMLCLASKNSAIPEFISDQEGILSLNEAVNNFVEQLIKILEKRDLYLEMRIAARKRMLEQCSAEKSTKRELQIIHEIIDNFK